MPQLGLKPTHKEVREYYDSLAKFEKLGIKYESAVRTAFHQLLEHCARQFDWKLVPEYAIKRKGHADAKADGALLDKYGLNQSKMRPAIISFNDKQTFLHPSMNASSQNSCVKWRYVPQSNCRIQMGWHNL